MSWFKRRPRVKEPPKHFPHRSSLISERTSKSNKDLSRSDKTNRTKPKVDI
jgi:hypothetical protein